MLKYLQTRNQLFYRIFSIMQAISLFCAIVTTVWSSTKYGYILFGNTREKSSTALVTLTSISLVMVLISSVGQISMGMINWSYDKYWIIILSGALSLSVWLTWFFKVDLTANVGFLNELRVMDIVRWTVSSLLIILQPFMALRAKK